MYGEDPQINKSTSLNPFPYSFPTEKAAGALASAVFPLFHVKHGRTDICPVAFPMFHMKHFGKNRKKGKPTSLSRRLVVY